MEKEFLKWLLDKQLIRTDALMDKYVKHLSKEVVESGDYQKIIDNLSDITIEKYNESKDKK
jgi:hypothetical protein